MNYNTIDISIYNSNQSWHYTEIRQYDILGVGTPRLRANIRRNAYDFQSYARIEKWSETQGWLVISEHYITEFAVAECSYTQRDLTTEYEDMMRYSADRLFEIGEAFHGVRRKVEAYTTI
jgi:hypothetical protein